MFIIISVIITLLEIKDVYKEKKIKLIIFFSFILITSIIIYIYMDKIPSLLNFIKNIKELFYGTNKD